jgi:hypothetical protein
MKQFTRRRGHRRHLPLRKYRDNGRFEAASATFTSRSQTRRLPGILSTTTTAAESIVSEIPKKVIDSAERIGGYLGVDERYFDANGDAASPRNAKYLVVGNYYGSAIYAVDGVVQRLRGFE